MRLLVARCEVVYTGRLTATLAEAVRLIVLKTDGSVLVHDDSGGYKPLNWIRSAFRLRRTRAHALVAS
jgi:RecB family endonuclease NucS